MTVEPGHRRAAELAGTAVGGLVDRFPFHMIFGLASLPLGAGAWVAWALDWRLGLGLAGAGLALVLMVLPALVRSRRLAREHAAQRAAMQAELDAALAPPARDERGAS